jgi:hypothetical protein
MKKTSILAGALALAIAGSMTGIAGHAAVRPDAGVTDEFNKPMCDSNGYERIKTQQTEYAVSDSAATCVDSMKYHGDFAVTSVSDLSWQFPNIASGYTPEGEATCASYRQDTCYRYPVKVSEDGMPNATFGAWLNPGVYNLSFDMWISPVRWHHSVQARDGNTEVMVWLAHPGITDILYDYTTIDGIRFGIMSWEARHSGQSWRYVAYVALNPPSIRSGRAVNYSRLWLNPFLRNAEMHGWLRSSEWLWTIDLGFELVHGGRHNNIHAYTLSGVQ